MCTEMDLKKGERASPILLASRVLITMTIEANEQGRIMEDVLLLPSVPCHYL